MNFYRISTDKGKKKKYAFGILINGYPSKLISCKVCGREWKKELLLEKETELTICLSNNNFADFIDVIYHNLISYNAKDVLNNRQITGYSLGHINIVPKNQISKDIIKELRMEGYNIASMADTPIGYYRLFVEVGAELHQNSEIILYEKCNICNYEKNITIGKTYIDPSHPLYLIENSWNGNDLFKVKEMSGVIFCTKRFVDVYKEEKLSGLLFDKIEAI